MTIPKDITPDEYVDLVMEMVHSRKIADHPFLGRLDSKEITESQLEKVGYQMMWYYNNSVRNIGSVLANHMDREARHAIMENLIDEETEARCGDAAHFVIALKFGDALGFDRDEVLDASWNGTLRPHPQLQDAMEQIIYFGLREEPALAMGAGMVGGESLLPDLYMRMVPALRQYGFTDDDLDIFIVHIEGDLEHAEEGKALIRSYANSPEQRERFFEICRFVRDRLYDCWDAVFKAGDEDLPQVFHARKPVVRAASA